MEFVSLQLEGIAHNWWEAWKGGRTLDSPPVEWEEFKEVFLEKFMPPSVRFVKAREIEALK